MTEIAPGIHSVGHGKGGHAHAFLIDHGGELSLVDTLFESDGRLLFEAIRKVGNDYRPRVVFTSSIAVFGAPFPEAIDDEFLNAPLTSYGTQ